MEWKNHQQWETKGKLRPHSRPMLMECTSASLKTCRGLTVESVVREETGTLHDCHECPQHILHGWRQSPNLGLWSVRAQTVGLQGNEKDPEQLL